MLIDRAAVRNVRIYDGATGASFGGMRQNGSITEVVFLWILNQILPHCSGASHCQSSIELTNEPWIHRIMSHSVSGREDSFRDQDGYKITVFNLDTFGLDGRILDPVCCNTADLHHVSDELLRWHFRQLVLANMRGAGEPIFEHDFPTGTDIMTEIREGPYAKERFEMELASRLRAFDV